MKRSCTAAVLSLVLLFAGCAARQKNVTDLPPGVSQSAVQSWDTAVANLHKIAVANSALRQLVISLNKQGTFPDSGGYATTLHSIGQVAQLEKAAADYLSGVPKTWGASTAQTIEANMNGILSDIQTINTEGITGIKDPGSLQQVNTFISEIKTLTNIILSLATGTA